MSGIKVNYDSIGMFDKIDDKTKTYLYRISQEALNNIIKHAAATEINQLLGELVNIANSKSATGRPWLHRWNNFASESYICTPDYEIFQSSFPW